MSSKSNEIALKVEGLSKTYRIYERPRDRLKQLFFRGRRYFREVEALQKISFEIRKGETVGVIGRNGSGKSTLLQMICGTVHPTAGRITTHGRVAALLELGAGFNPEFTGRENVFLNASLYGLSRKQIEERFDKIAAFADIGAFIDQPVRTYSSGMFVRLAFAVIAHVDADILIIDEALAVGDAYFVQKCMRFLRSFTQNGTLLFVSHDTTAIVGICSKVLLLNRGRLEMAGAPKEVSEFYLAMQYKERTEIEKSAVDPTAAADSNRPPSADFGLGSAQIISVALKHADGRDLAQATGEEHASLDIQCLAIKSFSNPLVGFIVRDRLGQIIFGDNTGSFDTALKNVEKDEIIDVRFNFVMPILHEGDYSVTVAISEGTQEDHVTHHWMHDALVFRSHPKVRKAGIIAASNLTASMSSRKRHG